MTPPGNLAFMVTLQEDDKLEGKKEFSGDETELVEEFSDKYAAQFLLMHYLEFAGDVAFHGSHARVSSIPGVFSVERNEAELTVTLSSVGCLDKEPREVPEKDSMETIDIRLRLQSRY
ncbi:hypothetical protein Q3G72_004870 [Acer saccharum]|nr:hypothetical protein Q3G72_004870 [Acer saccharum]